MGKARLLVSIIECHSMFAQANSLRYERSIRDSLDLHRRRDAHSRGIQNEAPLLFEISLAPACLFGMLAAY